MAHISADRIRDTSTTTGSGNFTVSGTAQAGYRTFSAVLSVSDTFYYAIQHQTANEWETGLGTYSSANVFARTTVYASSNSGSAVVFSSGTKDTFITLAASRTVQLDNSGNVGIGGSPSYKLDVTRGSSGVVAKFTGTASAYIYGGAADVYFTSDTSANNAYGANSTSNYLNFYTNSSERMRIDSSGNVGIGTASPGYKLEVNGNSASIGVGGTTSNLTALYLNGTSNSANGSFIQGKRNGSASYLIGDYAAAIGSGAGYITYVYGANPVVWYNNSIGETMRIDGSGNVGVGTSSPSQALTLGGSSANIQLSPSITTNNAIVRMTNSGGNAYMGLDNSAGGLGSAYALHLYHAGAYPIVLSTNNAERMRIDSSGNVGIGVAPSYKLDLLATGNISGQFKTSGSINALYLADAGTTAGTLYIGTVGNDFRVVTGSNERMRIDSSGNVLMNTSSALSGGDSPLYVNGSINTVSGNANISANSTQGYTQYNLYYGSAADRNRNTGYASRWAFDLAGGYLAYSVSTNTTAGSAASLSEKLRIDSSGNVGIGTTSGGAKLNIQSGSAAWFTIGAGSTAASFGAFYKGGTTTNIGYIGTDGGGIVGGGTGDNFGIRAETDLILMAGASERARITSAGLLQANAISSVGSSGMPSTVSGNAVWVGGFASPASGRILIGDGTGWQFYISSRNSGTTTDRFTFGDTGNFTASGNVTAYSDARLKKNVVTIDGALALVEKMRGVRYDRIDSGKAGIGVIAQEMQEVVPEVVHEGKNLSVAYGNLVGVLIEAVKELSGEVKALSARVKELENK